MKIFKWVKDHPAEAMAIAAGLAITGGVGSGALLGAGLGGAEAAGAAGLGAGAVAGDAFLPAALASGGAGGLTAAEIAAGGGEAVSGAAASHLAGAGLGSESALLSAYPLGEDFAAQMAGNTVAGGGGSALLGGFPAPSSVAGAGAEASLYGPNVGTDPATALDSRSWWDKYMADKFKDPKKTMMLGLMLANAGTPRQQGGPMPMQTPAPMRSAIHSQEEITKAWLMRNDPNTYRRIYGNPQQGVA